MPARSKYHEGELVQRLLDNWARWPGWAGHTGARSTLAWLDDFVSNKRQGDQGSSIPVMGGEAADTHRALGAMRHELAQVLVAYYTWHGTVSDKMKRLSKAEHSRMSRPTFYRRLEDAHYDFMTHFRAARDIASRVGTANHSSAEHAGHAVARRHRFVVSPKLALKTPEKEREISEVEEVSENGQ